MSDRQLAGALDRYGRYDNNDGVFINRAAMLTKRPHKPGLG